MPPFGGYICTGFCARLPQNKDQIGDCHSNKESAHLFPFGLHLFQAVQGREDKNQHGNIACGTAQHI